MAFLKRVPCRLSKDNDKRWKEIPTASILLICNHALMLESSPGRYLPTGAMQSLRSLNYLEPYAHVLIYLPCGRVCCGSVNELFV